MEDTKGQLTPTRENSRARRPHWVNACAMYSQWISWSIGVDLWPKQPVGTTGYHLKFSPVYLRPWGYLWLRNLPLFQNCNSLVLGFTLRKLYFHFLSHWMRRNRGDSFLFDFEPNGIPLGSKSKRKLSPRSCLIQCERVNGNIVFSVHVCNSMRVYICIDATHKCT